jgi:hypothetical protein
MSVLRLLLCPGFLPLLPLVEPGVRLLLVALPKLPPERARECGDRDSDAATVDSGKVARS